MKPKIGDLLARVMPVKPHAVWYYRIVSSKACLLIASRHYIDDVFLCYVKDASLGATNLERGYKFRQGNTYVDGDVARILSIEEAFELQLQIATNNVQI
jgi:hypothetical protein